MQHCLCPPSSPQADKERPWRRYDQDIDLTATFRRYPIVEAVDGLGTEDSRTYRLDIEVTRLEFQVHPTMAKEDLLVGRV